jgi:hypothetical protein
MRMATGQIEPLVLSENSLARRLLGRLRYRVEHILDQRALSWLSLPVAMDEVPSL